MPKSIKLFCLIVGLPAISVIHGFIALQLFGILFAAGDSYHGVPPPSVESFLHMVSVIMIVMAPLFELAGLVGNIVQLPESCYIASFFVSGFLWWALITWFFTTGQIGKIKKRLRRVPSEE